MLYRSYDKNIQYVNQIMEVGQQSFFVGLLFFIFSIVCFLVAISIKTKDKKNKKQIKRKKIILYVFGSLFAMLWFFFSSPFFQYIIILYS